MKLKAIKIQIYPNNIQKEYIENLFGCSRFVFNKCLDYKINVYNETKKGIGFSETGKYLTVLKNEFEWLRNVHSKVLQQSLINLEDSYKRFFKNGMGFPNFKSKHNKQSCRFPKDGLSKQLFKANKINIIKPLSNIIFKCSKRDNEYLNENISLIKSATLSKTKTEKYFLSILIEDKNNFKLEKNNNSIGIDLGIKDFIVTSNNERFENIKIKRNNQLKLNKLHRSLSKKQKDSKNRNKSRIKLAKFYEKLNNKKEHYLHSIVNKLINENQVIITEDLNVKGMMKNHNLARSIQELSINRFLTILKYKCEWYGRDFIQIDRFYPSSKICNSCKEKNNELKLSDRSWKCKNCGSINDRDYNASLNIKEEGLKYFKTNTEDNPEI